AWVTLPASVTTIASVQMVYVGGAAAADDFLYSSPAIYGCLAPADLSITKTDNVGTVTSDGTTTYTVVATNNGPAAANNPVVRDDWTLVPGLDCSTATGPPGVAACAASGTVGTQCPATVTPELLQTGLAIPALPSGGVVTFTVLCRVTATGQ
ncbi:MAG: DUF11 domain-containing protein, partial [Oxalobacteraceae bacterium]